MVVGEHTTLLSREAFPVATVHENATVYAPLARSKSISRTSMQLMTGSGFQRAGMSLHSCGIPMQHPARVSSSKCKARLQGKGSQRHTCNSCRARATREDSVTLPQKRQQIPDASSGLRAAALALACAVGIFSTLGVSQAWADEETYSPSEKRAQESQRRRDLLSKAREKALAGGGQLAGDAPAPSPAPKKEEDAAGSKLAASSATQESPKKQEAVPAPKPQPASPPPKPQYSYEKPTPPPAPKPTPRPDPPKAPAPALKSTEPPPQSAFKAEVQPPKPAIKPELPKAPEAPAKPAPKPELPQLPSVSPAKQSSAPKPSITSAKQSAAPQKGIGKQKGPLPMTVAQVLVLGIFGGIGYATTKEAQRTAQFVEVAAEYVEKGYNAVENYVAKYAGKPSETVAAEPRTPSGKDATEV